MKTYLVTGAAGFIGANYLKYIFKINIAFIYNIINGITCKYRNIKSKRNAYNRT